MVNDHVSDRQQVKASASELIGLYGLLREFVRAKAVDLAIIAPQVESFNAACACIDTLLQAKRQVLRPAEAVQRLREMTAEHMRLHLSVYGNEHMRPKHHWQADVADQILRDGMVLDSFVIERKHLVVKRIADHVKNPKTFERSVLAGVTNVSFNKFAQENASSGLQGRQASWPADPDVQVADKLAHLGLQAIKCQIMWVCIKTFAVRNVPLQFGFET